MSSVKLDLDFQDYTPTSNNGGNRTLPHQIPEVHVRIPSNDGANSGQQQSNLGSRNALQHNTSNSQFQQSTSGGISDEALQQLIWLAGKQKNKQQRGSISSSGGWGLGYFAQYFDVTTDDVLQRILWSAVPVRKAGIDFDDLTDSELTAPLASGTTPGSALDNSPNSGDSIRNQMFAGKRRHYSYIERFIQSRPDMYGPFWISTTLIFAVAIFSNIASYKHYRVKVNKMNAGMAIPVNESNQFAHLVELEEWHYSVDELNTTASLVMFYVTLLPTFLWFLFWFRGCTKYYTLTETICAYGYSLSIFIPLSFLLIVQATIFRYLVLILAALLSGSVLVMSFLPTIHSDPSKSGSHIILVIVFAFQLGLAYVLHRIMLQ